MLGKRLGLCMELASGGKIVCDVGTDHAYLPCELVMTGKYSGAIASDISEGPLESAKKTIMRYGLSDRIDTVLSDGLQSISQSRYSDDISSVIIAGMGGENIAGILAADNIYSKKAELILQPMTRQPALRAMLAANGFEITREEAVQESDKIYIVMKALYTGRISEPDEADNIIGKLDYSLDVSRKYLEMQLKKTEKKYNGIKKSDYIMAKKLEKAIDKIKEVLKKNEGK